MASRVNPREVKRWLYFLGILADALQKSNSLAMAFLFVVDLRIIKQILNLHR